jgi:hypothetical protein
MGFDNDHLGTLMPFGAPSTPSFAEDVANGFDRVKPIIEFALPHLPDNLHHAKVDAVLRSGAGAQGASRFSCGTRAGL